MQHTVFLITREKQIKVLLKTILPREYYLIEDATAKDTVQKYLKKTTPDLIILDSPKDDILTTNIVIQEIKRCTPTASIILLQDPGKKMPGTFDCSFVLTKPVDPGKLLSSVQENIARNSQRRTILQVADLQLDRKRLLVSRSGKKINLSPQEFQLLHYLMRHQGKGLSRKTILKVIWQYSEDIETRVVDVYIGYLRKKIDAGFSKKLIHSLRGIGYTLRG